MGCIRCFETTKHQVKNCPSGSCIIPDCGKYHHISIHDYSLPLIHYDVEGYPNDEKYTTCFRGEERVIIEYQKEPIKGFLENCLWCGQEHEFLLCNNFQKFSLNERHEIVNARTTIATDTRFCKRCLENGHTAPFCRDGPCPVEGCEKLHHPMLHDPPPEPWSFASRFFP